MIFIIIIIIIISCIADLSLFGQSNITYTFGYGQILLSYIAYRLFMYIRKITPTSPLIALLAIDSTSSSCTDGHFFFGQIISVLLVIEAKFPSSKLVASLHKDGHFSARIVFVRFTATARYYFVYITRTRLFHRNEPLWSEYFSFFLKRVGFGQKLLSLRLYIIIPHHCLSSCTRRNRLSFHSSHIYHHLASYFS